MAGPLDQADAMNGKRLRNWAYGLFLLVCAASLGWPFYPLFASRIEPLFLGVPFSLAWIVAWAFLSFLATLAYDLTGKR
jgi:hypothetical protein